MDLNSIKDEPVQCFPWMSYGYGSAISWGRVLELGCICICI